MKKPVFTPETIKELLNGSDPQEGIRSIEATYGSNIAQVFVRDKETSEVRVEEYQFTPFLWSKAMDEATFFSYKTIGVKPQFFDLETNTVVYNNRHYEIDGVDVIYEGLTPDEKEGIFTFKLKTKEERIKHFREKKQEYGIEIEELITTFDKNKKIKRMENGFKYMVSITPRDFENATVSSNPKFKFNGFGKVQRITGSYTNLLNFFKESGVDVYAREGLFLNTQKIKQIFKENDLIKLIKMAMFIGCYNPKLIKSINKSSIKRVLDNDTFIQQIGKNIIENGGDFNEDEFDLDSDKWHEYLTAIDLELFISRYQDDLGLQIDYGLLDEEQNNIYENVVLQGLAFRLNEENVDIFTSNRKSFFAFSPAEQFMIQSGKRLFKGVENYDDLNILTMDIETKAHRNHTRNPLAALSARTGVIFKIGIRNNKGFEKVMEAYSDNEFDEDKEREMIEETFKLISELDPDIVEGWNDEKFDIPFILERASLLGVSEDDIKEILHSNLPYNEKFSVNSVFRRGQANLKVGGASERYIQTFFKGKNKVDGLHSAKRSQAIDSKMEFTNLKYTTKYLRINKTNRVYVQGDQIGKIENDKRVYYFNENDGKYFCNTKSLQFDKEGYNKSSIKLNEFGQKFYKNNSTLFLYSDYGSQNIIELCENSFKMDFSNLDKTFEKLYEVCSNYETVVAPFEGFGVDLKNGEIGEKFKQFRQYFNDVKLCYPNINFEDYKPVSGKYIVERYLLDDLWETYTCNKILSQATFEICKWLPTTYQKSATLGGAGVWKLLLSAAAYKFGIAIPDYDEPRKYSGGLVGMVCSGFVENIVKLDFGSLYPSEFLEHVPQVSTDILGLYHALLKFVLLTRLDLKDKKTKAAKEGNKELEQYFDKKQHPLKILINSFYGMLGAIGIMPFADVDSAHSITCLGRQHARHVIRWFGKRGFKVIYFHTDGVNFIIPKNVDEYVYKGKGVDKGGNWYVKTDKEYVGVEAYVAEYNDRFMKGVMGLSIDAYADAAINLAKGNAVYLKKGKKGGYEIDITGGAIVKKNQSEFIKDFLGVDQEDGNLMLLLKGQSLKFVQNYQKYATKIYEGGIVGKKIASKFKVSKSKEEYLTHISKIGKNGNTMPKQAAMELLLKANEPFEKGDWIYYVNTGKKHNDKDYGQIQDKLGYFVLDYPKHEELENKLKDVFDFSIDKKDIEEVCSITDLKSYIKTAKGNKLAIAKRLLFKDWLINLSNEKFKWSSEVKDENRVLKKQKFIDNLFLYQKVKVTYSQLTSKKTKKTEAKTEYRLELHLKVEDFNCKIVDKEDINSIVEYNKEKYLRSFNKSVEPLFIVFKPETRDKLLILNPTERKNVLSSELELISGIPLKGTKEKLQDNLDDLMKLSEDELFLWKHIKKSPNYAFDDLTFETEEEVEKCIEKYNVEPFIDY